MGSPPAAPEAVPIAPWRGLEGSDRLAAWRSNVGQPVALDFAPLLGSTEISSLAVLSWNLWIGRGRLAEVVARVRETTDAPLVVLAQEAFRADASVPHRVVARRAAGGFRRRVVPRTDIVELAAELRLNLRYVPSMRNGTGASDRGNAILSNLPLAGVRAFELPLVLQRRVPLLAMLELPWGPMQIVNAHLDPRGPAGTRVVGGEGRARQTRYLLDRMAEGLTVLGADLNLSRGKREAAWRLLHAAGFTSGVPAARQPWRHTFHALPRLVLDYVLLRVAPGGVAAASVERLDEHPRDRGPTVFGSDHHPLLARIQLNAPGSDR
ncbi:MAG TPA: endonuclease/exonuclease/phosphatase family protein [Gemmatimonadales bacterium]|nr:endonuclease/exonuclease/phosphatase family protein [Gemmatimonadales bacterium]